MTPINIVIWIDRFRATINTNLSKLSPLKGESLLKGVKSYFSFYGMMVASINKTIASTLTKAKLQIDLLFKNFIKLKFNKLQTLQKQITNSRID